MSERRPAFIGVDYDRWTGADSDDEQIDECNEQLCQY
jgi:hypothetical protein